MQSFAYYSPTEVLFGKGTEEQAGKEVRRFGGSRVQLVYGGGSVVKSGLLDRIKSSLLAEGVAFDEIGGVQPNPRVSLAREGVRRALDFQADFILAVGGGSAIDTAKAIAHGAANPATDIWKFWMREAEVTNSLPVGVVLTISAAGSETSDSAVLTNEETGQKVGLNTDFNRPRFAIMNPELTYTLPTFQVACGIVDIMMHTLDRYFTHTKGNRMTDELAEALLRVVIENGPAAMQNHSDYEAMSELMWCGSLSHNHLTGLGAVTDFSTHKIGHELSGKFDVAHGASLSAVWGSWASYVMEKEPERFARYARTVWGIADQGDASATARAGIEATVRFFRSLNMPTCFTELGIGVQDDSVIEELARRCTRSEKMTIGHFQELTTQDIAAIFKLANR